MRKKIRSSGVVKAKDLIQESPWNNSSLPGRACSSLEVLRIPNPDSISSRANIILSSYWYASAFIAKHWRMLSSKSRKGGRSPQPRVVAHHERKLTCRIKGRSVHAVEQNTIEVDQGKIRVPLIYIRPWHVRNRSVGLFARVGGDVWAHRHVWCGPWKVGDREPP